MAADQGEPFVVVDKANLSPFVDKFNQDFPKALQIHQSALLSTMFTSLTNKQFYQHKNPDVLIAFTLITTRNSEGDWQNVYLYCHEKDVDKLTETMEKTHVIDFNIRVCFSGTSELVVDKLQNVSKTRRGTLQILERCVMLYVEREKALEFDIDIPEDVHVKSLGPEDAETVYNNWRYKDSERLEDFSQQIASYMSAGVFLKENHKLVTWIIQTNSGSMGCLFTLPDFRSRGHAKLVVKYLSIALAQRGFTPFAFTENFNEISQSCFAALGFREAHKVSWAVHLPQNLPAGSGVPKASLPCPLEISDN